MDAYFLPLPLLLRERPLVTKEQTTLKGTTQGVWPLKMMGLGWGGAGGLGDDASFWNFKTNLSICLWHH